MNNKNMNLTALLLLAALASATAAPQMIIGQSVMEAFRAAIESQAVSGDAEVATEAAPAVTVPVVPVGNAARVEEQPIVAIILPADSELPIAARIAEKQTPAPAPPTTAAPAPTAPPVPAPATVPAPTFAPVSAPATVPASTSAAVPAPATVPAPTSAPVPAPSATAAPSLAPAPATSSASTSAPAPVEAPQVSPTAELEQAAAVSPAQVDQSLVSESAADAGPVPAASGRSLDSAAPATAAATAEAAAVAPTVVPILMDERDPMVGNAFGFRFRSGDGQFRSEKSSLKLPAPGVVVSPNALPEYETVGEYSFTHPDGTLHRVTYTAGLNGYVATGNMLPTPPPMPVWALEQIQFAEEQKRLQAAAAARSAAPTPEATATVPESADASAVQSNAAAEEPAPRVEDTAAPAAVSAAAASDTAAATDTAAASDVPAPTV